MHFFIFTKVVHWHAHPRVLLRITSLKQKKKHGSNIFRPLHDMEKRELSILVDNIIKGSVWLSIIVDPNVDAETLF